MTSRFEKDLIEEIRLRYSILKNKTLVAQELGVHRETVRRYTKDLIAGLPADPLPEADRKATYIITSAQNNTEVHGEFWRNLTAYARFLGASIIVGGFIYNKDALGQRSQEKTHEDEAEEKATWDQALAPYLSDKLTRLAPSLVWCGNLNVLPTAADPLSGLLTYTRGDSAIFPHAKVSMRSVATPRDVPAKMVYTTGACTLPNYIQRKAGQVAEFHHVIGALIVEVDGDDWWVRQLIATDDGSFQDLDRGISGGEVGPADVFAINWGDVHRAKLEDDMLEACWGGPRGGPSGNREESIIERYRPAYQFLHDALDAESMNPHEANDHFRRYELAATGRNVVRDELNSLTDFVNEAARPWCMTVFVPSNHHDMFRRWLLSADFKRDPANMRIYHQASLAVLDAIDAQDEGFDLLRWYMAPRVPKNVLFLPENDPSFVLKGIEFGQHGHIGPNGVKGTPQTYRTVGLKFNTGHTHTASIYDGVYTAGVQARLFHGYNKGLSSWSNSMIFTYSNGKRAIVTMRGLRHRA